MQFWKSKQEYSKISQIIHLTFRIQYTEHSTPDTHFYTPTELQAAIVQDEMRFTTVSQDRNEYVADDGTRIKIQPMIMRVAKNRNSITEENRYIVLTPRPQFK